MSKVLKMLAGPELRAAGWSALVKSLGVVNATRYLLQFEPGHSDYVQIKKGLFKNRTVKDVIKDIKKFERSGH